MLAAACRPLLFVLFLASWAATVPPLAIADEPASLRVGQPEIVHAAAFDENFGERLLDRSEDIWLDGDVLWFAKRDAGGPWNITGSISQAMAPLQGTDIWAVGLRWDRWSEAFIRVSFTGAEAPPGRREFHVWRGEHAPEVPHRAQPGLVETIEIDGPVEGGRRKITVVLPPGTRDGKPIPAIVLADGQSADAWGDVVAALVLEGSVRPLAIVGIHSGGYDGDRSQPYDPNLDLRAKEYLDGHDPERFDAHLSWVIDSVLPEVSRRYAVSLRRDDLAVAGFSNGGAFAATAAARRSDRFRAALALSVGVPPEAESFQQHARGVRFFLAAGELEPRFFHNTEVTHHRAERAGWDSIFMSYVAGHEPDLWILAAAQFVPLMFPPTTPSPADNDSVREPATPPSSSGESSERELRR
ncbi:MAG: alpha/beta hydrolase [Phycisphaerales bacterium]